MSQPDSQLFIERDPSSGYFQDVWDRAQAQHIRWPGFERMTLSTKDRD